MYDQKNQSVYGRFIVSHVFVRLYRYRTKSFDEFRQVLCFFWQSLSFHVPLHSSSRSHENGDSFCGIVDHTLRHPNDYRGTYADASGISV